MLDERLRFSLLLFLGGLVVVLLGWGVWVAISRTDVVSQPEPAKPKVFRQTLFTDFHVRREGGRGVEFIKCGACRVEKRKRGVLTLGGMNVLVVEDLEVVIPPEEHQAEDETTNAETRVAGKAKGGKGNNARAVVRRMGITDGFLSNRGMVPKFSGIRITNLAVNRLEGSNQVVRVFSARTAEAEREGLKLTGCRVIREDGEEEDVNHARLKLVGRGLRLEWKKGKVDIL